MKSENRCLFILVVLTLGLFMPICQLPAQTFTTLHTFTGGSDGANPLASLILSGSTLYGTAAGGGSNSFGTVFALNTDGTSFTVLHTFTGDSDGANPSASLILSSNTLYGTTFAGTTDTVGAVFALNTDGTGFVTLHTFTLYYLDGGSSSAALVLSSNTLYGTTQVAGSNGCGTVFAVNTDGTGYIDLFSFNLVLADSGAHPSAPLIISGNRLYGTAYDEGTEGNGAVFALDTDGIDFVALHDFNGYDGALLKGALVLSDNTLYGTTLTGTTNGSGAVFAVNTDGTGFTDLYSFTAGPYSSVTYDVTNSDGAEPYAALILFGNTLYGTCSTGGTNGYGTVFSLNTDGTGFTVLHTFTGGSDGSNPRASLILSGCTLYGTTSSGGTNNFGTVFSLTLPPPQLAINQSGTNVVLTWPINFVGIILQSAPQLTGTFTNIPVATSPYTNPITGNQMFFRLSY